MVAVGLLQDCHLWSSKVTVVPELRSHCVEDLHM